MRVTKSQQRALQQVFTAKSWSVRVGAILVLLIAAFGWWQQNQVKPGQLSRGGLLQGEVVQVADGDTITLRDQERKEYRLRLAYIDAPEKAMSGGSAAKNHLQELVLNQQVQARVDDVDRYGRGVARIERGGQDINLAQLQSGHAWHYAQYAKKSQSGTEFSRYQQAQQQARKQKSGLWRESSPTPPWEWRAARREQE
ncbi:thermonuclease family protein [Massilia sp. W12]|uniref:thermonuclease family protein n=1 Tax=Massilia sp. W12 TaxID=3126507 RepID=UPI0030CE828E